MASDKKTSHKKVRKAKLTREFCSRVERIKAGRLLREKVPRENHAIWKSPGKCRDVIAILQESNKEQLQELVPIRYGRMLRSFTAGRHGTTADAVLQRYLPGLG